MTCPYSLQCSIESIWVFCCGNFQVEPLNLCPPLSPLHAEGMNSTQDGHKDESLSLCPRLGQLVAEGVPNIVGRPSAKRKSPAYQMARDVLVRCSNNPPIRSPSAMGHSQMTRRTHLGASLPLSRPSSTSQLSFVII